MIQDRNGYTRIGSYCGAAYESIIKNSRDFTCFLIYETQPVQSNFYGYQQPVQPNTKRNNQCNQTTLPSSNRYWTQRWRIGNRVGIMITVIIIPAFTCLAFRSVSSSWYPLFQTRKCSGNCSMIHEELIPPSKDPAIRIHRLRRRALIRGGLNHHHHHRHRRCRTFAIVATADQSPSMSQCDETLPVSIGSVRESVVA